MPNRDGTGPNGKGSKTGRGLGSCRDGVQGEINKNRGMSRRWIGRMNQQGTVNNTEK